MSVGVSSFAAASSSFEQEGIRQNAKQKNKK
ncbi:MAG: hypothetical protein ACI8YQ_004696 [Polaribacter sp.]|jgi:hypothetical protein